MKIYTRNSAAWKRQKETQKHQRIADVLRKPFHPKKGQKYLYPELRDKKQWPGDVPVKIDSVAAEGAV